MVDISYNLFKLLYNNCFFDDRFNLFHSLILASDLDNFFVLPDHFFNLLNYDWHFNNFLDDALNVPVHINNLRNNSFHLHNLWNFYYFLMYPFHFIYFGNCDCSINDFFHNLLGCDDFLDDTLNWHYFLNNPFHLFDTFSNVRNFLHNFFVLNTVYYLLFDLCQLVDLHNLFPNCYNLFNNLGNLHYLFNDFSDRNNFLNYFFSWNRDLNWHNNLPINLDDLSTFDGEVNYFFNLNSPWYFLDNFNHLLDNDLIVNYLLFIFGHFYEFINDSLHDSFYFNIDIFRNLNFHNFVLNHWDLNDSLHFFYFFLDDNFWNHSLNNLGDFHNFLNDSRHNNDFLHYFLYFDHFGNLHHFLNNFFNRNFNFFNSVNVSDHFDYLLFDIFDWLRDIYVVVHYFLHLHHLGFFDDDGIPEINLLYDCVFNSLYDWFFNELLDSNYALVDDWHLDDPFNLFGDFSYDLNWNFHLDHNLFNSLLNHNLLNHPFHLLDHLHYPLHRHNFLYDLRDLYDSFYCLNYGDGLFDNSVNYFIPHFDVIVNLLGYYYLLLRDDNLNKPFNFHNFGNLNHSFYNLFNNHWDLLDNLNDPFSLHNFLNNYFHLLHLSFYMIDNFLHLNYSFNFYWPLFNPLHNLNFRHLSNNFYNPLHNLRNVNDFFNGSFDRHHFLHNIRNDRGDFKRNIDNFLNFPYFLHLYDFFYYLLNCNYLWHLHNSVHNFLYDFLDFDNLRNDSENFQDIIDIYDSHDFLIYHSNNSLINFKNCACPFP